MNYFPSHYIHIHFHKIQHSSQWINISSSGRVYIVAHVAFNESWSTWLHLLIFQPLIPNLSTSQIHSKKSATKNLLQIQKLVHYPWWAQILFTFFIFILLYPCNFRKPYKIQHISISLKHNNFVYLIPLLLLFPSIPIPLITSLMYLK